MTQLLYYLLAIAYGNLLGIASQAATWSGHVVWLIGMFTAVLTSYKFMQRRSSFAFCSVITVSCALTFFYGAWRDESQMKRMEPLSFIDYVLGYWPVFMIPFVAGMFLSLILLMDNRK